MSHEINYSKLTGAEKREKALKDLADWFNKPETMEQLKNEIAQMEPCSYAAKSLRWQFAMFAGVQGYPVVALLGATWNLTDEQVYELLDAPAKDGDE